MKVHREILAGGVMVVAICAAVSVAIPVTAFGQSMNAAGNPCAGAGSTVDTVACFAKAYEEEDHRLNQLYARIQKVLVEDEKAALVKAERLWVQYRDATCDAERTLYGGGTGGYPTKVACLAAETRARHDSLLRSYGWVLEKRG
jgi:uncharacterized protein YecT (DUF1311 family)